LVDFIPILVPEIRQRSFKTIDLINMLMCMYIYIKSVFHQEGKELFFVFVQILIKVRATLGVMALSLSGLFTRVMY